MSNSFFQELKLLYHICLASNKGTNHQERMENYFGPQAKGYDSFRDRLLHNRQKMYQALPTPEGGVWYEMGGGTGRCLEYLGDRIHQLSKIYLVDLSPGLLEIAEERKKRNQWTNVEIIEGDASSFHLDKNSVADVVTFSYSLSMIPPWYRSLAWTNQILRPNGTLGAIDFYLARKHPVAAHHPKQSLTEKAFWSLFFRGDDVFPNPDHLAFLNDYFNEVQIEFGRGKLPYLPLWAPNYLFIGTPKKMEINHGH